MLYPFTFRPIFKERIWGGQELKRLYGKELPPGVPIGESWEISDRPGDISVVANGPLAGKDLHWLVAQYGPELLGSARPMSGRFPLLIKLLDARQKLSLQVHPPAAKAALLGGAPKTEMWYIGHADPGAELHVGLRRGVTKEEFESRIKDGTVAECFHRIPVQSGDAMFLPSGRVHAIGSGLVIFEIQQNSDTTYRVFDWNRKGADGKPRQLHIEESLQSIDFTDFEPALLDRKGSGSSNWQRLVQDPLFSVDVCGVPTRQALRLSDGKMQILSVVQGIASVTSREGAVTLGAGQFSLIPACLERVQIETAGGCTLLRVEAGKSRGG